MNATEKSQTAHPPAFFSSKGEVLEWNSATVVDPTWTGVVKSDSLVTPFWYVGQKEGQRSFSPLNAITYAQAEVEGAHAAKLNVDIATVLRAVSVDHSVQFTSYDGTTLGLALRERAMWTVDDVVGTDCAGFETIARARLRPVFHSKTEQAELELEHLVKAFVIRARDLIGAGTQTASAAVAVHSEATVC